MNSLSASESKTSPHFPPVLLRAIAAYESHIHSNRIILPPEVAERLRLETAKLSYWALEPKHLAGDLVLADRLIVHEHEKAGHIASCPRDPCSQTPIFDYVLSHIHDIPRRDIGNYTLPPFEVNQLGRVAAIILKDAETLRRDFPVPNVAVTKWEIEQFSSQPDAPEYLQQAARVVLESLKLSRLHIEAAKIKY